MAGVASGRTPTVCWTSCSGSRARTWTSCARTGSCDGPQLSVRNLQTLHARSHLVLASRAAAIEPPIDSVFPLLGDDDGLRDQAQFARSLGFFGKSAIHPRQLETLCRRSTPMVRR